MAGETILGGRLQRHRRRLSRMTARTIHARMPPHQRVGYLAVVELALPIHIHPVVTTQARLTKRRQVLHHIGRIDLAVAGRTHPHSELAGLGPVAVPTGKFRPRNRLAVPLQ